MENTLFASKKSFNNKEFKNYIKKKKTTNKRLKLNVEGL